MHCQYKIFLYYHSIKLFHMHDVWNNGCKNQIYIGWFDNIWLDDSVKSFALSLHQH